MSNDWIKFDEQIPKKPAKTKVWAIRTTYEVPETLGFIKWFGRWRKYAFFPLIHTVWEQDCLRKVASFCELQTKLHKQK